MRENGHYIIFRVHSEEPLQFEEVKNAIWNSILNWLGDGDTSKANIWIIKNLWSKSNQTGYIKCMPKYVDQVKVALALIHQVADSRIIVESVRVSGTIKSGKKAAS